MNYFFDSYALVEILQSNPRYVEFREETIITANPNLAEVYYYSLRTEQTHAYHVAVDQWKPEIITATLEDWENAAHFKFTHKNRKLSFVDCLGYQLAQKNGLQFLTGDSQFEKMPNVRFIQ